MDGSALGVADDVASAVAAVGCVSFRGAFSGELQPAKAPAPIAMIAVRGTYFLRIFSARLFCKPPSCLFIIFPPLSLYHHWWMMPILDL
jgi:hypothetical protein